MQKTVMYDGLAVGGRKVGVIFSALNGLNVSKPPFSLNACDMLWSCRTAAHHETRVFVGQPQLFFF